MPPSFNPLMAFSADGTRLAVRTLDRTSVSVWDTETLQPLLTLIDDDVPTFLAFTSKGQLIVVNAAGGLTIWETQRPKCPLCPKAPAPVK